MLFFKSHEKNIFFPISLCDQLDIVRFSYLCFFSVFSLFSCSLFNILNSASTPPISKTALVQATKSPVLAKFSGDFHFPFSWSLRNIWLLIFLSLKPPLAYGAPTPPGSLLTSLLLLHPSHALCFLLVLAVALPQDFPWILSSWQTSPEVISCLPRPSIPSICSTLTMDLQPIPITELQDQTFKFLSSIPFCVSYEYI